jgi:hypothetical protein
MYISFVGKIGQRKEGKKGWTELLAKVTKCTTMTM